MANTYNFKINAVDCHTNQDGLEKVVYNVHWSYFGTSDADEPETASVIGVESVDAPSAESFTAFESLTEDIVIGWIEAKMGEERIQSMKDSLDAQIQEKVAPTKVTLQLPVQEVTEE
jgi:hypothetical protein